MTKKKRPEKNVVYDVPVKGSLGLFAYGDKGLRAWRKVRDQKNDKSEK